MLLKSKIPVIYHTILSEILEIEIPDEKIATCASCILCMSDKSPYLDSKCCNYFPKMPNYLVGGVLVDEEQSLFFGKSKINEIVDSKIGVSPLGILPGKKYETQQQKIIRKKIPFHSKEDLEIQKCPYYDDGKCGVWKYRENLCVTFFCVSIGGEKGDLFWKKLNELLIFIEFKLAKFCSDKISQNDSHFSTLSTKNYSIENKESEINVANYISVWGEWNKKEKDFFIQSFEIVKNLTQSELHLICGKKLSILVSELKELSVQFNSNKYPEYLVLEQNIVFEPLTNGKIRLHLQEKKLELDLIFLPFIKLFDGRLTTIEIFHKAYQILHNLNHSVDQLLENKMLVEFKS